MITAACILLGLILAPTKPRDQYPSRLRNVLDSQPATTSQVEWTSSWISGRDAGLVERYVTRRAGDALWASNLGDEHGFHEVGYKAPDVSSDDESPMIDEEWLRTHEIPKEELAGTRNSLIYDGQAWHLQYAERPLTGDVQPMETAREWLPIDLPSIGLAPCWVSDFDANPYHLKEQFLEGFDSATFRERVENGLPTLSAEWGGNSRLTWRFDYRYGGNPVRAGFELNDELAGYSETEYEKVGERWFPKSVRFYEGDSASPYRMIDVQRATFDEPWHIQEITPTDIGALHGTQFASPDGMKTWTGAELIPLNEYLELVELYGVLPDPRIIDLKANLIGKTTAEYVEIIDRGIARRREEYRKKYGEEPWLVKKSPKEKDEWDVYVEKFKGEHKLPEPAVKRADEILEQSKNLRDARRGQNTTEIRRAEKENDKRKLDHFAEMEKRIFDRVLVRNLKKLIPEKKNATQGAPPPGK